MGVVGINFNPRSDAPGEAAPPLHHPAEAGRRRDARGRTLCPTTAARRKADLKGDMPEEPEDRREEDNDNR